MSRRLPELLDHVDALIAEGVLGATDLNAADYQIGPSVRLLMAFDDLRSGIEGRPAGALALRMAPHYPGHPRSVLPAELLRSTTARGAEAA
jgi:glutathione S-transferase